MITFQSATSSRSLLPFDLQSIFWRAFPKDYQSILGFAQSIGGKSIIQKSKNNEVLGNKSMRLKRVEIRFSFGGIAVIRQNTVTLSGRVPWEKIYRVLVRVFPEAKSLTFTITNTAVRFYLKKNVKIESIAEQRIKSTGFKIEFTPELYFSRLLIRFSTGEVASVFANGTVVAQGKNLANIEDRVKQVLNQFKNPYGTDIKGKIVPARYNLEKKRLNIAASRYDLARGWTNVRAGYYVRPGPNKAPRFYKIPSNPSLIRQKVLRAYANVGVNVPYAVRMIIGEGVLKPKKKTTKETVTWNTNVPGMYVRPGPGGLPKLYKIPKLIPQGKKTVISAYKKVNVPLPLRVRQIFGISTPPPPSSQNKKLKFNVTDRNVFRIDGLDCMRYKINDLRKIAGDMDISHAKLKKEEICKKIKQKATVTTATTTVNQPNFTLNNVNYTILPNNRRIMRQKRSRSMNSYKINELKSFILAMDPSDNVGSLKSKKNLINRLIERKRTKNLFKNGFNFTNSDNENENERNYPLNIARQIIGNRPDSVLKEFLESYLKIPRTPGGNINKQEYNKLVESYRKKLT